MGWLDCPTLKKQPREVWGYRRVKRANSLLLVLTLDVYTKAFTGSQSTNIPEGKGVWSTPCHNPVRVVPIVNCGNPKAREVRIHRNLFGV